MFRSNSATHGSMTFRCRGSSHVVVEVLVGDGQLGGARFRWRRSDGEVERWGDDIPKDGPLAFDFGPGDDVPVSRLEIAVLVEDVNPHTNRTSVTVTIYQEEDPDRAQTTELSTNAGADNEIIAYSIRIRFRRG